MQTKELIFNMIKMQQKLNDDTNGLGWENGYTNKNKIISWRRCIYMECAELIDSFAWKHWKDISSQTDEENLRVEVVDIWHFIMSLMLEQYHIKGLGDIEKLCNDIVFSSGFDDFCKEAYNVKNESIYEIINDIERLINECSSFEYDMFDILKKYFVVALKCGVNLESLYECYVAKNVLNKFRQDNGYKEGTYKKIWDNREDNVVMSEIIKLGVINTDEIYDALQKEYAKIK
ncbi:dUTPase, dimeric [Campylobacter pinnipediorum subsp. caledonicus]|uniref:dUTPase, dimeric n=1 Tax=Campylobacter pinnipediorum subsp. caledonicus TaxID=1874362 RepID=A0A1S6U7U2_9BACT|nr:dUTP diphosphatase [Campylobacter pinnipediorum]AQW87793.1 dUTPase, dimeric [Campylobacter pinnipediorum subsp. caledonicus]OPA72079.1 dUTPase [Campylobacter pinnipediorum subsp. caledonicus]